MSASDAASQPLLLVLEFTAASPHSRAELLTALGSWFRADVAAVDPDGIAVLSLRIASDEIDRFGSDRGWSEPPDAIVKLPLAELHGSVAAVRALPAAFDGEAPAQRTAFVAVEAPLLDDLADRWSTAPRHVKMVVENGPTPRMTLPEFRRHWETVHGPLVARHGRALGYQRYTQSRFVDDEPLAAALVELGWREPPAGGMAEVWWQSEETMGDSLESPEGLEASAIMEADEKNFVHPPSLSAFLSHEYRNAPAR